MLSDVLVKEISEAIIYYERGSYYLGEYISSNSEKVCPKCNTRIDKEFAIKRKDEEGGD